MKGISEKLEWYGLALCCLLTFMSFSERAWAAQSVEAWQDAGRKLELEEKYDRAIEVYTKGLKQYPDSTALLKSRASVYLVQGEVLKGRMDLQKILALDKNNVSAYIGMAMEAACSGNFKDSWDLFQCAVRLEPDNADIYIQRGRFYYEGICDFKNALKDYRQAQSLLPAGEQKEVLKHIMFTYDNYAEYRAEYYPDLLKAADDFLLAEDLSDQEKIDAHRLKCGALQSMNEYESALAENQKCILLLQDDACAKALALAKESELLYKLNRPAEAKKAMLEALKNDSGLPLPRYYEKDPAFAEY